MPTGYTAVLFKNEDIQRISVYELLQYDSNLDILHISVYELFIMQYYSNWNIGTYKYMSYMYLNGSIHL